MIVAFTEIFKKLWTTRIVLGTLHPQYRVGTVILPVLLFTEYPIKNENEGRRETEKYKQTKKKQPKSLFYCRGS